MKLKKEWTEKGFIDEPVSEATDLKTEIRRMCKEKNAVIMAHYYCNGEIQDVADFIGDSLALARKAAETDADIIVMCGVHFMAETCKILSPEKLVLAPDLNAGCSLADSCKAEDLKKYKEEHPGYKVISYVNTTAAVKALTDVVVTSGNAKEIVDTFPQDEKIIFGPDYNLGSYINNITGRQMLLWNGGCHAASADLCTHHHQHAAGDLPQRDHGYRCQVHAGLRLRVYIQKGQCHVLRYSCRLCRLAVHHGRQPSL